MGNPFAPAQAMKIASFRDLRVWQLSMQLAVDVYVLARRLPPDEKYGLSTQLRRTSVSIPSNIAEGTAYGRNQYLHHLRMARGSEAELQTQLELTAKLALASAEDVRPLLLQASEIGRMLSGLITSLRNANSAS
jgi:carbamoyl-phosphate synthase large subunit